MPRLAVQAMLGGHLKEMNLVRKTIPHFGVKEAVFPFYMFPEVDPVLGPEMRSTGEVLGLADSYGRAFFKAQEGTGTMLPTSGAVLITVAKHDRVGGLAAASKFADLGFKIFATEGTQTYLSQHGISAVLIKKMHEGRPNIADAIKNKEIQLVVNTPIGRLSIHDDSYIRKAAIRHKIPYITTTAAAVAAAEGIAACRPDGKCEVRSLQEYHQQL